MTPTEVAIGTVVGVLFFRLLPLMSWLIVRGDSTMPTRVTVACCYGGAVWLAIATGTLNKTFVILGCGAVIYFALVAVGAHWLARWFRAGWVSPLAILVIAISSCLLVPAMLISGPNKLTFTVVGFEAMLSVYSYVHDVHVADNRASLSNCIHFILVNPVLVFAERRIAGPPKRSIQSFYRVLLGVSGVAIYGILASRGTWLLEPQHVFGEISSEPLRGYVAFWWGFVAPGVALYAIHSGVASIQIGVLGAAGYSLPERYSFPFMAKDPWDWWKRWNRYTGSWIERYVHAPLLLWLLRRTPDPGWRGSATAFSVIAALGFSGALHEMASVAGYGHADGRLLVYFLGCGVLMVVWREFGRWLSLSLGVGALSRTSRIASFVLFLHVQAAALGSLMRTLLR